MGRKTFQGSHVELRHKVYFAVLSVPKDIRHIIGKPKFFKTTGTGDLALAEKRAALFVAQWKTEISRARHESQDPFIAEALSLREHFQRPGLSYIVKDVIDERTEEITNEFGNAVFGNEFKNIATGKRKALETLLPEWVEYEKKRGLKQKTIEQASKDVTKLLSLFSTTDTLLPNYIDQWLRNIAEKEQLRAPSISRIVSSCRSFFNFLKEIGEVSSDTASPFIVPLSLRKSKRRTAKPENRSDQWVPFLPKEVEDLHLQAIQGKDQPLADLILIAAHTGTRIEEICSLKCEQVDTSNYTITIIKSKTCAGERTIPIHKDIQSKMTKLKSASTNEYLLPDLTVVCGLSVDAVTGTRSGARETEIAEA